MIYDKTCGKMQVIVRQEDVGDGARPKATVCRPGYSAISGLELEDLRDLRHLIDAALRAAK